MSLIRDDSLSHRRSDIETYDYWDRPGFPRDNRGRRVITHASGIRMPIPMTMPTAAAGGLGFWGTIWGIAETGVSLGDWLFPCIAAGTVIPAVVTEYISRKRHHVLSSELEEEFDYLYDGLLSDQTETVGIFDDLEERHSQVIAAWMEYELDPLLALSYPAMVDYDVPQTVALYQALDDAHTLRTDGSREVGGAYRVAIQNLEVAFKAAEAYARKVGVSTLSSQAKDKVLQAQKMLTLALDDSASLHERQIAYDRAVSNLKGIMLIPNKLAERIETSMKQITAQPEER